MSSLFPVRPICPSEKKRFKQYISVLIAMLKLKAYSQLNFDLIRGMSWFFLFEDIWCFFVRIQENW